ncbi:Retrovirus-related Pol polyprotein from transposon TNT 1-94 [Cucumis melo var. makuwa]|uniref:Retrovirus-related Pol polyprotein from transposon TNT 1-94 n=1 Tax=Cucumis melo var. makuwa TaxID=1194695 RepID=A0A5D3BTT0_CUCMM|nr:Retrovirus-related Pol polyprotein from transposon TNT 1-94 [Cucumis melo var. makuwa]
MFVVGVVTCVRRVRQRGAAFIRRPAAFTWVFDKWVSGEETSFRWVLSLGIRGDIRHLVLSVPWCLIDGKVVYDGYDSVEALMVSHRDIQNAWIMDFGCTYHITPNRDFLINFQKSDGGKVLLGDNGTYEVKGSDSVLIATHDGMSRMLTNVRGTLRNGLYVLEGTVVSEATEQSEFDGVQFQQESSLIDEGVYNDIITSDSKKQRKDAMEAELFILRKNHTWSLVTKPLIQKLIQQKWFKQGGDNKPRYKVRLVAKVLPAHSDGALRQVGFNGVFSVSSRRASTALGFRRAWVPLYGSSVVGYLACSRYFTRGSLERRRVSGGF